MDLDLQDGLPEDEAEGMFFGFDENDNMFLMWWSFDSWRCAGRDPNHPLMSLTFATKRSMADYIKRHAAVPAIEEA